MNIKTKGLIFSILSSIISGLGTVLTKKAGYLGADLYFILTCKGAFGALYSLIIISLQKKKIRIKKDKIPKLLLLGLLGMCVSLFLLNTSYSYMPVGLASTIHFLYPAVISIISTVIFREKIPSASWITIFTCLIGMAILAGNIQNGSVIGIIFAASSSFSWAFYMTYIEKSGLLEEDSLSLTFCITVILSVFGILYGFFSGEIHNPVSFKAIPVIALIALIDNVIACILLQKSEKLIGPPLASIFSVFEPISSIFFGLIIMHEIPAGYQIAGCSIILTSIIILLILNLKKTGSQNQ